jgi:hypothetical protein
LLEPASPDADSRELGCNVETVDEDERSDDEDGRKDH